MKNQQGETKPPVRVELMDKRKCPDCPQRGKDFLYELQDHVTGEMQLVWCDVPECPDGQAREVEV